MVGPKKLEGCPGSEQCQQEKRHQVPEVMPAAGEVAAAHPWDKLSVGEIERMLRDGKKPSDHELLHSLHEKDEHQ